MTNVTINAKQRMERSPDYPKHEYVQNYVELNIAGVAFTTDVETASGARHLAFLTAVALGLDTIQEQP